jgi:hypothetical protein
MHRDDLEPGDYVEHRLAPNTIWEAVAVDPWTPDGGQATLRWIGGQPITYELRKRIFNVFINGSVTRIRELNSPNPMMLIALVSQ